LRNCGAKLRKRKIGLALGSGAARGLAHIGVLEVLGKEGIPVDMITGSSVGAFIGALYAQGKDTSLIRNLVLDLRWQRLVSVIDLTLPKTGFIGGKKIKDQLEFIFGGDLEFSELKIPFACVATDIMTGEEVVLDKGSVLEGIRASISIPGIFSVVKLEGRYLVDGGLVSPVPVDVLKRMGADFIIAVNVIPDIRGRVRSGGKKKVEDFKEPSIISVIIQSIYISAHALAEACLEDADVAIQPQVTHIGWSDFHRAPECILQGELAAQGSIPEIKRKLAA